MPQVIYKVLAPKLVKLNFFSWRWNLLPQPLPQIGLIRTWVFLCLISELCFSLFLVNTLALHFDRAMHVLQIHQYSLEAQFDTNEKQNCKLEKSKQKNKRKISLFNFSLSYFFPPWVSLLHKMLLLISMEYFPIRPNYYTYFLQKYLNKIFWLQYYCI